MKPTGNKILIKKLKTEKKQGSILLPDSASDEKFKEAEVVAVGPGIYSPHGVLIPVQIKVGDKILINNYGGMHVKTEGSQDCFLIREEEVLAILS